MKTKDLIVGQCYIANIHGDNVEVRLDSIQVGLIKVTNLKTNSKMVVRSVRNILELLPEKKATVAKVPAYQVVDYQHLLDPSFAKPSQLSERIAKEKAISAAQEFGPPHLIVNALAGTGKTTTIMEGLKFMKGERTSIVPSPQQQSIWDKMMLSKDARSICMVAFNKAIAQVLKDKVPRGVNAMTLHSMGLKACQNAWSLLPGSGAIDGDKVNNIIAELLGVDIWQARKMDPTLVSATNKLVGLCKSNLLEPTIDNLDFLTSYYEIELEGNRPAVYDLVPEVIEECLDVMKYRYIDFNDMVWLPVAHNIPVTKYDLLCIDESQDLSNCQQSLAIISGHRILGVGDKNQAIYGFTGASTSGMQQMFDRLNATSRGCEQVPLTVTRRCGHAIVEEARKIVPTFEAHESNPPGIISRMDYEGTDRDNYRQFVNSGDMVICRVTAPLVSQCFKFIKAGVKAQIQGRDIGAGLLSLIKKFEAVSIVDLIKDIDEWLGAEQVKENAKKHPSEAKFIALQDKYDCLMCFAEEAKTVQAVIAKIDSIFTDAKQIQGVLLSTCHKCKGLEADRVFLLLPAGAGIPHPMARSSWQLNQEMNIKYISVSRAREEFIYVE